jgi:hypothetical protein
MELKKMKRTKKAMMPGKVEGWEIVDAARAGVVVSDDPEKRFLIGTYEGCPIRTSFIVHDGSPSYVETNNSIYALGAPQVEEKPLTPIQNQAVAVAKKSIIDTIAKDVGRLGPQTSLILDDSAQATAHIIIRALANAHLLVS